MPRARTPDSLPEQVKKAKPRLPEIAEAMQNHLSQLPMDNDPRFSEEGKRTMRALRQMHDSHTGTGYLIENRLKNGL